jgi:hypothetical protein
MFFGKTLAAEQSSLELGIEIRAIELNEMEFVAGGAGGSSTQSSTYASGGADGYGGSRRNP